MTKRLKVELVQEDGSSKEYLAPQHVKGRVLRKSMGITKKLAKLDDPNNFENFDEDILLELYDFIATDIFNNQFTKEEYEDGIDFQEIMNKSIELLNGAQGADEVPQGKQAKK